MLHCIAYYYGKVTTITVADLDEVKSLDDCSPVAAFDEYGFIVWTANKTVKQHIEILQDAIHKGMLPAPTWIDEGNGWRRLPIDVNKEYRQDLNLRKQQLAELIEIIDVYHVKIDN